MVSRALIRAKVNYGLGKAGAILGYPVAQYRPTGPTNPISGSPLSTIMADFDNHPSLDFTAEVTFAKFQFYLLGDPTNLLPGDYLVGQGADQSGQDTFFVSACGGVEPAACVRCNRVVSFLRDAAVPAGQAGAGYIGRSGNGGTQRSNKPAFLTGWPASVLQGTKGNVGNAGLPEDVRSPWVAILMPILPAGLTIKANDQMIDDLGVVHTVSSVELSPLGWRLTAEYALT
jgi:hypothetical protein